MEVLIMAEKKFDIYAEITDRVCAELEKGNIPWHKPWLRLSINYRNEKVEVDPTSCAYSRSTGKPYSLLNQMLLGRAGEYATFKQIQEAGGKVKKGEKSSMVVFWKFIESKKVNAQGEEEVERIPVLRYFSVFHVATQVEGLEPKKRPVCDVVQVPDAPSADAEWDAAEEADAVVRAYLERTGVTLTEQIGSDRAFYSPAFDSVTVPARAQFKDAAEFYSTLFHELTHSTGHKSRLDRFSTAGSHAFGSENYSKEELVAEIGAAALNNQFGLETKSSFRNSAAYIQSWLSALRDDKRLLVSAASRAEKAVNLILGTA
jgi:antirestriction protein ArdC